jgi:hypothetical protein
VISIASEKDIDSVPEADRVHEMIVINTVNPIYVTRAADASDTGGPATSDMVVWNNTNYRVIKVYNYQSRGYWWAIAGRMAGD